MHNVVLNRIREQIRSSAPSMILPPTKREAKVVVLSSPISPDELRALLMSVIEKVGIIPAPVQQMQSLDELHINNVHAFSDWYEPVREKFTPLQQVALDTIVQSRQMVNNGCACKRELRDNAAHAYFQNFWTNNWKTDLVQAIFNVAGAKRIFLGFNNGVQHWYPAQYT